VLRDMKDGTHNHSWALHGEAEEDQDSTEVLDEASWALDGGQVALGQCDLGCQSRSSTACKAH
jgi:hypothetical protein